MGIAQELSWKIIADEPSRWGRKTTKEEQEDIQRTKHTPGKKKKRGRSQHIERYSPELQETLEKGKRCGNSYIAKEDECHQDDPDFKGKKGAKLSDPPKKPRTKRGTPHGRIPKVAKQPGVSPERFQTAGTPKYITSPEAGNGVLKGNGYLSQNVDGIYEMDASQKPHRVYFPKIIDQAAAQYVSSAIADLMGLESPDDYFFRNYDTNQVAAGHEVLSFTELDEWQLSRLALKLPDIAAWFVHSVLVRHDDVMGTNFDNMVLLDSGRPAVLHFGGTLLWTSHGNRRSDGMSPKSLPELETLRSTESNWQAATVFGSLGDEKILEAIHRYLASVEEKDVLDLVDAAKFAPDDRVEIGKGLISRKRLLESL